MIHSIREATSHHSKLSLSLPAFSCLFSLLIFLHVQYFASLLLVPYPFLAHTTLSPLPTAPISNRRWTRESPLDFCFLCRTRISFRRLCEAVSGQFILKPRAFTPMFQQLLQ